MFGHLYQRNILTMGKWSAWSCKEPCRFERGARVTLLSGAHAVVLGRANGLARTQRLGDGRTALIPDSWLRRAPVEGESSSPLSFSRADALRFLGLSSGCSARDVRKAYLKAARALHPDKGGTSQKFQQLQKAMEHLTRRS